MAPFRVALSADFRKADGSPLFPDFDLKPLIEAPGVEVLFLEPADSLRADQLADADALILLTPRLSAESIHPNGRLAVVARFGVGYDNVDVDALTRAGIPLVITPDGVRRPVAVSIIALMLALTGRLRIKDRLTREGPDGFNRRAQFMGCGLAKPFDMAFIAHDPYAAPELAHELGVELVELDDVFRRSDVLAVNCPLTADTRHLVNAPRLALMKPTAFLINTARGPIVDQKALTAVLQDERIAGAGLDVFEREPPPADDPLLRLDNAILTPHALCWTDQCFAGNGAADVRAVLDVQHGRVPHGVVNRDVLDGEPFKRRLERLRAAYGG
jgi:phosphoglycerate dehydrogenase-like enzyme